MKERPILFSASMVRAILDGRKTQTRRIVKDKAGAFTGDETPGWWNMIKCPHGAPGDRLWVKETVRWTGGPRAEYVADGAPCVIDTWPWKLNPLPSMYMPRGASRLTLEVTAVRCERLQDITEDDIVAEGCTVDVVAKMTGIPWSSLPTLHVAWREAWDSINGKRAPWSNNPWVWAISFRRVTP